MHFFSYNNAVPIALSFMTLSFGAAFASSEEVRESVYRAEESVVSIDNTYIANKDLAQYAPSVRILEVTEDTENYYVTYELTTIDIVEYVWQDITKRETMRVAKSVLGTEIDLGLYVTRQLNEVTNGELARLRETQKFERQAVSQKVVATKYGGLVGRFLDVKTDTLPGYQPVVVPPPNQRALAAASTGGSTQSPQTSTQSSSPTPVPAPTQTVGAPELEVLGANPARVPVGASYVDLGVVVHDPPDNNASVYAYLNDSDFRYAVGTITIDTSTDGTWLIRYVATDADGNTAAAERTVIVGNPVSEAEDPQADGTSGTTTDTGVTEPPVTNPAPTATVPQEPEPAAGGDEQPTAETPVQPTATSTTPGTGTGTGTTGSASSTPQESQEPEPVPTESASEVPDTQATTTQE